MRQKALITGATGFIGSHLAEALVDKGWSVTCLIRLTSRTDFIKRFPVSFVLGHANDQHSLEEAVEGKDYVFHSAAQIRPVSRETYDLSNHQLTRNLLQACLRKNPGTKRFIYISSISAGGPSPLGVYADESLPPAPESEYGRSKLKGEEAVKEVWNSLPATIIRPPNVYGIRQQETMLLVSALKRRVVPLLRYKEEVTSLIYIRDLVDGIVQAALSPKSAGQVYYLTDGRGYSWREIILTLKKHLLGKSLFLPVPESLIYFSAWVIDMLRKAGIANIFFGRSFWKAMTRTRWLFSSANAERDFGFSPKYSLEEGVRDIVETLKHKDTRW